MQGNSDYIISASIAAAAAADIRPLTTASRYQMQGQYNTISTDNQSALTSSYSSSGSGGSWSSGGHLPPPPNECTDLEPSCVPLVPAKPWDTCSQSDEESPDEGKTASCQS